MTMTDLEVLSLPDDATAWLDVHSRQDVIARSVEVDLSWWRQAIDRHQLPGEVLEMSVEIANGSSRQGLGTITRADIFAAASEATESDRGAATLLWSSLAWGGGRSARNMERRLTSLAADWGTAAKVLRQAAELSASEPMAAFEAFRPSGNTFKWLGPAFFSKFLYFAGGGGPAHQSLILDSRVATSLKARGWGSLRPGGGWPANTYERYCKLLRRWATEVSTPERAVAADELEYWLFEA